MNHILKLLPLLLAFLIITSGAFYIAYVISHSQEWQTVIQNWGILGMLFLSFVSSINAFIPIPPAAFAPMFLSAGFSYFTVIACFTIGTAGADSLSYVFGWFGRGHAKEHHAWLIQKLDQFIQGHKTLILPATFMYMAFAPLPNEYIMIPLALAGYQYRQLLLPLAIGNFTYFTWTVYGFDTIFDWFFSIL